MKRILGASALLSLFLLSTSSHAQQAVAICLPSSPPGSCFPVSATNPLPTIGSGGGGSSNINVVSPLGHGTADAAAVSVVPSATSVFPVTQSTSPWLNNLTQWGSAAVGAATAVGTEASGNVPTVNAHITNASGAPVVVTPFAPNGQTASLSVTAVSANVALPTGVTVSITNTGTNTAFVNLGTSGAVTATSANQPIGAGATTCFAVGANTFLAAIETAGTTTLSLSGGSGNCSGFQGSVTSVTVNAPPNDVTAGPQNFTGAASLTVNSQGSGSVGLVVSGTFTGAAWTLQGSVDGTNYAVIPFWDNTSNGTVYVAQPSATVGGTFVAFAAGYKSIKLNVTAVSTGTLVASLNASAGSAQHPVSTQGVNSNINGISGTAPVSAGTAGILGVGLAANGASLAPAGVTNTGAITVLSASGNGAQHEYMTGIQIGRTDAGTTAITAAVTDGTLTLTYVVPNSGGGGGNNVTFLKPFQWALNHAVTCAASSGVTTFYCSAQGFNAP